MLHNARFGLPGIYFLISSTRFLFLSFSKKNLNIFIVCHLVEAVLKETISDGTSSVLK